MKCKLLGAPALFLSIILPTYVADFGGQVHDLFTKKR